MKKALFIVPLLILLTATGYTGYAQSTVVNSRTRTLSVPHGKDAIVRFFGSGGDMFVYNKDLLNGTNVFTCRSTPTSPYANRYAMPITTTPIGRINYTVDDIVVVDKMSFFCGTKTTPRIAYDIYGDPYVAYDKMGYIGQMILNQMTNTPNGTVKYRIFEIEETKELKRIDAIVSPSKPTDTLLALVGTANNNKSCFLIMKEKANKGLKGEIQYAPYSEEEFTDMVFCAPYFAIASRFPINHWIYGMRGGDIIQNYYNHIHTNDLYYLNIFNTAGMKDVSTNMNTTWHYENVDIKLCHQNSNRVYLAYESFVGVPSGFPESQTSLFLMEVNTTSDIQINTLQNVDSGVKDTNCFADMVYVPSGDYVALLHKNTKTYSPWKSVMQFTNYWGSPTGVVHTYAATDDETLTSLDIYNNEQVWAAGTRPSHNDSVVLFYQNSAYTGSSCYNQPNYHTAELDPIVKADRFESPLSIIYPLHIETSTWKTLTAEQVYITQRCFTKETASTDSEWDDDTETDTETEQ